MKEVQEGDVSKVKAGGSDLKEEREPDVESTSSLDGSDERMARTAFAKSLKTSREGSRDDYGGSLWVQEREVDYLEAAEHGRPDNGPWPGKEQYGKRPGDRLFGNMSLGRDWRGCHQSLGQRIHAEPRLGHMTARGTRQDMAMHSCDRGDPMDP